MNIAVLLLTALLAITEPEHAIGPAYDTPLPEAYESYVCEVCAEYGLDPAVVFAVMWQESRFQADAIGDHGQSHGIMQIKRCWHEERIRRLGVNDLLDEWQAVWVGCDYLAELIGAYGSYRDALTAYRYGDLTITGEDYAGIVLRKAEEIRQ